MSLLDVIHNNYMRIHVHDNLIALATVQITNSVIVPSLYSGISFAGSTIGIAFTGTMCSSSHSVGLVEDRGRDLNHVISTTAHELGHIFGMNHDTCK